MQKKLVGYVGVDSGQVMIGDPCYVKPEFSQRDDFHSKDAEAGKPKLNYGDICNVTLSPDGMGQIFYDLGHPGAAVVSSTGVGDGSFPVYADFHSDGSVASLTIEFS